MLAELTLLLLTTALPEPSEFEPGYAPAPLALRLEAGVNRSIDGIDYLGDNGFAAAALRFAHRDGWYVASEFLVGAGDGRSYPAVTTRALSSALGFRWPRGPHTFALELQDYRWSQSGDSYGPDRRADYRGLAANYGFGPWQVEIGTERDRPLYYAPLDRFILYDIDRLAIARHWELTADLLLSLAAGHADPSGIPPSHAYLSLVLASRWQGLDWQLRISQVEDAAREFYPLVDRTSVGFSVGRSFSLP
ncbi:MAG: hypothetical protein R3217_06820 [Gammaproteobacteria bacterium]|nr:hypothetical protein [Gammaproteobacteria bacterium]